MRDKIVEKLLLVAALSAIGVLTLITIFIFQKGLPVLIDRGPWEFLGSKTWSPDQAPVHFGLLTFLVGSAMVTTGALVIGVPLALACAIVLAEIAPLRVRSLLKPTIELLAGIPSVVYGFIGMEILVPWLRHQAWLGHAGFSALAASIVLGIMILPTIIGISIDAIEAVPKSYREGSRALGATEWQTITGVVLPAARSGLVAAIILGIGRAVGETMAVIMVAGNSLAMPHSILKPVRTLTANIVMEMPDAKQQHQQALFATAIVLFLVIMILNYLAGLARRQVKKKIQRKVAA